MAKNQSGPAAKKTSFRALGPDTYELQVATASSPIGGRADLSISFLGLPPPSKKFVANGFSVVHEGDLFHLVFIQNRLDGKGIRTLLDVHMAEADLRQFGISCRNIGADISQKAPIQEIDAEPDQSVAVSTSFIRAAQHDTGNSEFTLYYVTPVSLGDAVSTGNVLVEVVARVEVSRPVFNACVSVALQHSKTESGA